MAKRRRRASRASKLGRRSIVQAAGFEVVDGRGRAVARLGPMPGAGVEDQGVGLALLGTDGSSRLTISIDGDGPSIHLSRDGIVRLTLAILGSGDEAALIAVRDGRGQNALSVAVHSDGSTSFHLSRSG